MSNLEREAILASLINCYDIVSAGVHDDASDDALIALVTDPECRKELISYLMEIPETHDGRTLLLQKVDQGQTFRWLSRLDHPEARQLYVERLI